MSQAVAKDFVLPAALVGRADLARLVREVEAVDNELESQKVRAHGEHVSYRLPNLSRSLGDFVEQNGIDLSDDRQRLTVREQLRRLKDKAPVVHMTFAVDADPDFLQQLVSWLRQEVHPQALVSVGLQPALIGGVYIRTPNHVHDFSIRSLLQGKRDIIVHELEGAIHAR